jgi:type II secretory pathway component PulF
VLFANEKVFTLTLGRLMAVGERTRNMDEMLT